jgi:hypothetical protein
MDRRRGALRHHGRLYTMSRGTFTRWLRGCPPGKVAVFTDPDLHRQLPNARRLEGSDRALAPTRYDALEDLPAPLRAAVASSPTSKPSTFNVELQRDPSCDRAGARSAVAAGDRVITATWLDPDPEATLTLQTWWSVTRRWRCGEHAVVYAIPRTDLPVLIVGGT